MRLSEPLKKLNSNGPGSWAIATSAAVASTSTASVIRSSRVRAFTSDSFRQEAAGTLILERAALAQILRHARHAWPEECCGIVQGRVHRAKREVSHIVRAPNVAVGDRTRRYELDPKCLVATLTAARGGRGAALIGFYHSHPDGSCTPSAIDTRLAWPDVSYLILTLRDRHFRMLTSWRLNGDGWMPEAVQVGRHHRLPYCSGRNQALKGPTMTAQGNALGTGPCPGSSPEGAGSWRVLEARPAVARPFGA